MPNITTKKNKIQHVAEVRPHFKLASREKKKNSFQFLLEL